MKLRKRIAVIAASAMMLTGTLPQTILTVCAEETQQTAAVMVATASVNVRAGDSASTKRLGSLTKGQTVTTTGKTAAGWYIINYNGQTGYVSGKYLTDNNTSAPATPVAPAATATPEATPAPAAQTSTDGATKTVSDGSTFVARGTSPGGLTMWYCDWDTGTWPDYIVSAYDSCGVTNDMSDYDKAVAINNYLCRILEYDDNALVWEPGETHRDYSEITYSDRRCITTGKAICEGYADAFVQLCTIAGVGADYCFGTATTETGITGGHAWNFVLIGDTKYYVDVCWNDGTNNSYLMSTTPFSDHKLD